MTKREKRNPDFGALLVITTLIWFGAVSLCFAVKGPKGGGNGSGSAVPMSTTHHIGFDIEPVGDPVYEDGDPGTSVTLDGGTYNMVMQCPAGESTCLGAEFDVLLQPVVMNPPQDSVGCPIRDISEARMTLWVYDVQDCVPGDCMSYDSTAKAQVRELENGGVKEFGEGFTLYWDPAQGGEHSYVHVTPSGGSWVVEGFQAVTVSGKGRNRLTCYYDASFSLTTSPK